MRIGIDVQWLHEGLTHSNSVEMLGGIGRYWYNLIIQLLKIDRQNEYIFFVSEKRPTANFVKLIGAATNTRIVPLPQAWRPKKVDELIGNRLRKIQELISIVPKIRVQRLDLFHGGSQFYGPFKVPGVKTMVTVFDMIPNISLSKPLLKEIAKWAWKQHVLSLAKADRIIAISESTKRDVIRYAGVGHSRVNVIYCGVSDAFRPVNNNRLVDSVLQKYKISLPFILHVGGLQKSKNIGRLLSAFRIILSECKPNIGLVMVGAEPMFFGREYKRLIDSIRKLDLDSKVTVLGYLPDSELFALYNRALLLAHPSLYEGFGLTPLEAMACGTPVVVSNKSSIPEVVGDAGIYVNPYQPEDVARGMLKCIHNKQLRNQLREKGLRRARLFSWEHTAEQTLGVYNRVFKRSVLK